MSSLINRLESQSKDANEIKCPANQILRTGYNRRKYTKADGTVVKKTRVESHCVKDMGKPGKGAKILPKPSGKLHLSKYGYTVHASKKNRRAALDSAAKYDKAGTLGTLRHLNLIANYHANDTNNREIMRSDVEYLKQKYRREKADKQNKQNKKNKQNGGANNDVAYWSAPTDYVAGEYILTDTKPKKRIEAEHKKQYGGLDKMFDEDEETMQYGGFDTIEEKHDVNGEVYYFYSVSSPDKFDRINEWTKSNNIEFDVMPYKDDVYADKVCILVVEHNNNIKGIIVANISSKDSANFDVFSVVKGLNTILLVFMERWLSSRKYKHFTYKLDTRERTSPDSVNFWYGSGYLASKIQDCVIEFEKYLQ